MRFNDFRYNLRETAQSDLEAQKAIHDVDVLSSMVQDMPPEMSDIKMKIANNLKGIADKVGALLKKANIQVQPQQPHSMTEDEGDVAEQNAAELVKQQIIAIENSNMDEATNQSLIQQIRNVIAENEKLTHENKELKTRAETAEQKQKDAEQFVKKISNLLATLGYKVQDYVSPSEAELAGMTSKEKSNAKKVQFNADKFTDTLRRAMFGLVIDIQTKYDATPQELEQFLQACVDGDVIDMARLIEVPRGNVKDFANDKYQKMFDIFEENQIFSFTVGKTSGAIGPGEMALSLMGNPANKGKRGDLNIGGVEVEIKASASSGGRLNSKAIAKATSGWKVWSKNIKEITDSAPEGRNVNVTNKKGDREKIPLKGWDGNSHGKSGKKGSVYNWNQSGFRNLNEQILDPYSDFDKTFKLFHETIFTLVQNIDKINNADRLIASAINQDGTVDYEKMNKAYTKIAYLSYTQTDAFDKLMLLRTDTLDFTIIENADELTSGMFGDNPTVAIGSGFNWNDDQQTPTPGYMAAKS